MQLFRQFIALLCCLLIPSIGKALSLTEIPVPGAAPRYSSPVIADITPDEGNEVVVAGFDGMVHAISLSSKRVIWSAAVPQAGCSGGVMSSPAIGNLYGNDRKFVVIGYGGFGARGCNGGVVAFDASNGALEWRFSTKDFAKKKKFWSFRYTVLPTPAIGDLDGDGKEEITFGSWDRSIYILESTGKVRRYYQAADTVFSSNAIADITSAKGKEVLACSDISQNKRLNPPTQDGGYMMPITGVKGNEELAGFRSKKALSWLRPFDQVVQSSPAIGDVTKSSPGNEIIVGSGCYFPERKNEKRGKWIQVIAARTGKLLSKFPTSACSSASPALGDLDGDGVADIVTISRGESYIGGDGTSHVYAYSAQKKTLLWDVVPRAGGANDEGAGDLSSPIIADVDGNGTLEVILNFTNDVIVLDGATGRQLTCDQARCDDGRPRLRTGGSMRNTPAVNNDQIIAFGQAKSGGTGAVYIFSNIFGPTTEAAIHGTAFSAPWPMFRGNAARSGFNG